MKALRDDLVHASKQLYRKPKLSLVLVICLTLGIGPNAVIYSTLDMLLITPPNVTEPDRLVSLEVDRGDGEPVTILNYPDYIYLREHAATLSHVVGIKAARVSVAEPEGAFLRDGILVGSDFFTALGRQPLLGAFFTRESLEWPGSQPRVVLSHDYWQTVLAGDPNVIGTQLAVNGTDLEIIGVAPADLASPILGMQPDFWVPFTMVVQMMPGEPDRLTNRGASWLSVIGRMAPGESLGSVAAEMRSLSDELRQAFPRSNEEVTYSARVLDRSGGAPPGVIAALSGLLLGLAGLVLLVACSGVAGLLLARATERRAELATRRALGATRRRIVAQLLVEGLVLALIAAVPALLMALWTLDLVVALIREHLMGVYFEVGLNPRVLGYTLGVALVAVLFFALVPALAATREALSPALKDQPGGDGTERGTTRLRNVFVTVQLALSVLLLTVAALFVRALFATHRIDPGFETEAMLVFRVAPSLTGRMGDRATHFTEELTAHLAGMEGVTAVATSRLVPMGERSATLFRPMYDDLTTGPMIRAAANLAGPDYFATMGIEIVAGRPFEEGDRDGVDPVVIIDETTAAQAWPGEDPIGKHILLGQALRVVGVARNASYHFLGETPMPILYQPLPRDYSRQMAFYARTRGPAVERVAALREHIRRFDDRLALDDAVSMKAFLSRSLGPVRIGAVLFGGLGFLALALSVIGIYGVMAYHVNLRRREIGIRLALGATSGSLLALLMRRGLVLVTVGLILGIGAAALIAPQLDALLAGIEPYDPAAFLVGPIAMVTVALTAIGFPARRAVRTEPMRVLRYE